MQQIRIVLPSDPPSNSEPQTHWTPTVGFETETILKNSGLSGGAAQKVLSDALAILGRCLRPGETGKRTGLIVGQVQSGKTTSFLTTAGLAADNGYHMVILLGGTSNELLKQNRDRFKKAVGHDTETAQPFWARWSYFQTMMSDGGSFEDSLRAIAKSGRSDEGVVVVSLMKQHQHMHSLCDALDRAEQVGVDLGKISTLIIDDEADQAGLNTAAGDGVSTTYYWLSQITERLPSHSLLQYTATPQANLLISVADNLSADFVKVLEPGESYIGGEEFFVKSRNRLCRAIPESELPSDALPRLDPPESLIESLGVYILGCAYSQMNNQYGVRSMMIHPDVAKDQHSQYETWIRAIKDRWRSSSESSDTYELSELEAELLPAFMEISRTIDEFPPFDHLLPQVKKVLGRLRIVVINGDSTDGPIDWGLGPNWVLIGGTLLDRGFTVEGLSVTYMPRGVGMYNYDNLQQRARFFGYKKAYLDICRVYLAESAIEFFERYVDHEELLRNELKHVEASGLNLKDWMRNFLIPKGNPTRKSVIRLELFDVPEWFAQSKFPRPPEIAKDIARNREIVHRFQTKFAQLFTFDSKYSGQSAENRHYSALIPIKDVFNELLLGTSTGQPFLAFDSDQKNLSVIEMLISSLAAGIDDPLGSLEQSKEIQVVLMSLGKESPRDRTYAIKAGVGNAMGETISLFQGHSTHYGGDRAVHHKELITIQIHHLNLLSSKEDKTPIYSDVPALAIHLPGSLRTNLKKEIR